MEALTESIRHQAGEKTSLKNRLELGADMGEAAESSKNAVSQALGRLKGGNYFGKLGLLR